MSLEEQAAARKARLAQLRKGPKTSEPAKSRNYDPVTQTAVQGSTRPPTTLDENSGTVEAVSRAIQDRVLQQLRARADVSTQEAIRPKKTTWDMERDIASDLELLEDRTDTVIRSMVRERINRISQGG